MMQQIPPPNPYPTLVGMTIECVIETRYDSERVEFSSRDCVRYTQPDPFLTTSETRILNRASGHPITTPRSFLTPRVRFNLSARPVPSTK